MNNKDTKIMPMTYYTLFSNVSIIDFEQVNVCWVHWFSLTWSSRQLFFENPEAYSRLSQLSMIEFFAKIVNGF